MGLTISFVKGRGHIRHNNRDIITPNVDTERTPTNITYKKQTLEDAYHYLFDAELKRYNKGKKPCRQIPDYMTHIKNSKNGEKLFYENVIQFGDMFSCGTGTKNFELAQTMLDEYMRGFEERNPNIYVFNAVMHNDEKTPHIHLSYIPVATGYKKGLQVRNSLDKALKQQGIEGNTSKTNNSTLNWQKREKKVMEDILHAHGLEKAKEKGVKRKRISTEEYKTIAEQVRNEVKEIPKQIETAPFAMNKNRVSVDKKDLENLEKRAKLSLVHEKATRETEKDIQEIKKDLKTKLANAQLREEVALHREMSAEEKKKTYEILAEQQKDLNIICKSLESENDALKSQISRLKGNIDHTIEKEIQRQTEPLTNEIRDLNKHIKVLGNQNEQLTKENLFLREENKKLTSTIKELVKAIKDSLSIKNLSPLRKIMQKLSPIKDEKNTQQNR